MKIRDIQEQAAKTSKDKNFHDGSSLFVDPKKRAQDLQSVISALLLIHSEVSEATELTRCEDFSVGIVSLESMPPKPIGFPSELADIIIRTCELAERCGIDLETVIAEKMAYNRSRPAKHGKLY